jgi:hypothetical protein
MEKTSLFFLLSVVFIGSICARQSYKLGDNDSDAGCDTALAIHIIITSQNPYAIPCIDSIYSINTQISGNAQGKHYTWSNGTSGANADSILITTAGNYSVTVTNNSGCASMDSVSVTYLNGVTNIASMEMPYNPICEDRARTIVNTSQKQGAGWTCSVDIHGDGTVTLHPTTTNFVYTFSDSGLYTNITLTMDSAGCKFVSRAYGIFVNSAMEVFCGGPGTNVE